MTARAWLTCAALALAGCGHPASPAECEVIMDRVIELKLKEQHVTDPAKVSERKTEAKARLRDEMLKQCVGRKVTDSAMACIRAAQSEEDIEKKCLR